jgi:hypothetical protein
VICPECETEYREGFTRCSDCDIALVAALAKPALVPLTVESSPDFVGALLEALEAAHVPYVIEAGTALGVLDGEEELDRPEPWAARIWVTAPKSEEAAEILATAKEATS